MRVRVTSALIESGWAAYTAGDLAAARKITDQALANHPPGDRHHAIARAKLLRASLDVSIYDFASALHHSRAASRLFAREGDVVAQASALILGSYVAGQLRYHDLAFELAMRAELIGVKQKDSAIMGLSRNYLGVTKMYRADWNGAKRHLGSAASVMIGANQRLLARPRMNMIAQSALQGMTERAVAARRDHIGPVPSLLAALDSVDLKECAPYPSANPHLDQEALSGWAATLDAAWRMDFGAARKAMAQCMAACESGGALAHWFVPYFWCAAYEVAAGMRDWNTAYKSASRAVAAARHRSNAQAEWQSRLLRARALDELQGQREAHSAWRALLADMLDSRRERSEALVAAPTDHLADVPPGLAERAPFRDDINPRSAVISLPPAWSSCGITAAERDVILLLCGGRTAPQIAAERGTQASTVRVQLKSIYAKTGLHSQQAIIAAVRSGLDPTYS